MNKKARNVLFVLVFLGFVAVMLPVIIGSNIESGGNKAPDFFIQITLGGIFLFFGSGISFCVLWFRGKQKDRKNDEKKNISYRSYSSLGVSKDYKEIIEQTRKKYFQNGKEAKQYIPSPLVKHKTLYDKSILDNGKIFYGSLVMANNQLFSNDFFSLQLPAVVLYSTDEYYDENPYELKDIAEMLFSYKQQNLSSVPEDLIELVKLLKNERKIFFNYKIPKRYTSSREVYVTVVVVLRKNLPENRLVSPIFPIIANPEISDTCFIVPDVYWSDKLIANYLLT